MFAFGEAIPHAPPVREAVQQLIDDVLSPLLERDASSIELLAASEDEVVIPGDRIDHYADTNQNAERAPQILSSKS